MNSLPAGRHYSNAPRTAEDTHTEETETDTSASFPGERNPLWLIVAAMAIFFIMAAVFLATD